MIVQKSFTQSLLFDWPKLTFFQSIFHKTIPYSFLLPFLDYLSADQKYSDHPIRKPLQNWDMQSVLILAKYFSQIFRIPKPRLVLNNLSLY